MMMKKIIQFIFLGLLTGAAITAYADDDHEEAKRLLESGDILALEIILEKARDIQPGKILEVELESEKGQIFMKLIC